MKVATIIPVYNAVKTLRRAVFSALVQAETQQIIVVDDGSHDGSLELALELRKLDDRIEVYQVPDGINSGIAVARNVGLTHLNASFFCFLDADDYYYPNRFTSSVNFLEQNPDADGVYTALEIVLDRGSICERTHEVLGIRNPPHSKDLFDYLVTTNYLVSSPLFTYLFRAKLKSLKFDESLRMTEDTDYIWRAALDFQLHPLNPGKAVMARSWSGMNMTSDKRAWSLWRRRFSLKWMEKTYALGMNSGLRRMLFRRYLGTFFFATLIQRIAIIRIPLKILFAGLLLMSRPVYWWRRLV